MCVCARVCVFEFNLCCRRGGDEHAEVRERRALRGAQLGSAHTREALLEATPP